MRLAKHLPMTVPLLDSASRRPGGINVVACHTLTSSALAPMLNHLGVLPIVPPLSSLRTRFRVSVAAHRPSPIPKKRVFFWLGKIFTLIICVRACMTNY